MLELADRLSMEKPLELAIKLADHFSMPHIATKMASMLNHKFPMETRASSGVTVSRSIPHHKVAGGRPHAHDKDEESDMMASKYLHACVLELKSRILWRWKIQNDDDECPLQASRRGG